MQSHASLSKDWSLRKLSPAINKDIKTISSEGNISNALNGNCILTLYYMSQNRQIHVNNLTGSVKNFL